MGIEMTGIEKKKFKIDLSAPVPDEPADDAPPAGDLASGRTTPWSLWMIFIAILVMGGAFVWGYHDLRNKLHAVDATGATEITGLSAQFNEHLESLEMQIADHTAAAQTDMSRLEEKIDAADAAIADVQAGKADQTEVETVGERAAAATAAVDALKKDIVGMQKYVDQMSARMEQAFVRIDAIQAAADDNRQQVEALADRIVDKDMLNEALAAEREFTQQNMAHHAETLYNEIAVLQKTAGDLQGRMDQLAQSLAEVPKPVAPTAPEAPPEPINGIIEQEIQ